MASTQGVNVSLPPCRQGNHLMVPPIAKSGVNHYRDSTGSPLPLNSIAKRSEIEHEYERKERLIEQAKAEWKKRTTPQEPKPQQSGLITDIENPKFDLEAFLNAKAAENP
ncbi:hypothetical protein N7468_002005 [Penicillium chermesinum]|uniref:ATP synthase F(0) complex subunit e, mitochondrial n=1 Tax=Penicillium chermesinum TaxID=63820 RepID=A0A9W9PJ32_9EURO|nr:uncharacterized protein N7468_002005 [Penicillium chermesinum]KAJ5247022.1 hypothetical protein N7468_002005 [Penicillium chermesinum]